MSNFYSQFPKQTRALHAIKRLTTYFEFQGNNTNESLPTMTKIVDYCLKHPRLLTLRDSPLRALHDPNIPYNLIQDWYIGISLDYLEAILFIQLVNDIYECFEHTELALHMSFSEGSALASVELKNSLKKACIDLIQKKISFTFNDAQETYCKIALKHIEQIFKQKQSHSPKTLSFASLFVPDMKYQGKELERQSRLELDIELPNLADLFNLSAEFLERSSRKALLELDDDLTIEDVNSWLLDEEDDTVDVDSIQSKLQQFLDICSKLNALCLEPDWVKILKEIIKERLNSKEWEEEHYVSLVRIQLKWLHVLILPWISYVMPKSGKKEDDWFAFLRQKIKAEHILYEAIYQFRIPAILDIIWDIPETDEVILDLQITANKRGLLNHLQQKLIQEIRERLLQQGVFTVDILDYYASCIRCLRRIDPSCKILMAVTEIIQAYMSGYRKDVAKGVVEMIRDSDTYSHICRSDDDDPYVFTALELNNEQIQVEPESIKEDMLAKLRRLQTKSTDITAMLISMCNPVKDFVTTYSNQLGKMLLSTKNYDTDAEILRLETLKLNFPPNTFIRCDIMLKDVADSKRIDKAVHESKNIDHSFHSIILSRKYWPGGKDDGDDDDASDNDHSDVAFQQWPTRQQNIENYMKEYTKVKASRKLKFIPTSGTVSLELDFETHSQSFDVRPEAAAIIKLFEGDDTALTKDEMADKLGFTKVVIIECLNIWTKSKVLKLAADGRYSLY
ncbi:hypothetical protein G6F46_002383 [Rhizopus delemar]|uniref:Cullin family profile domain-containing protein n=2 Tax=Rhizopus TaxID=4842 RepID=A0A9P6ZCU9_9FUNG|nr:hypothetical protein G6F55_001373 [Rhizopus delemar]KAG1551053.1 hypothetical protein G6F51_002084 [Rhizopus arrhizus]KAG1503210.1 hypothetical protein G6F54_001823 [Rhizopus delemar]KAG1517045.1 hypothetical protein G6F53_001691 [Rhizopus delemar]KAG1521924.1 hypothetical protein G6F52_006305 [Rhizopus delemar]